MTPLERLKELNEKATPGPWTLGKGIYTIRPTYRDRMVARTRIAGTIHYSDEEDAANAEFIAATRNLLPELIALWEEANRVHPELIEDGFGMMSEVLDALNSRADEVLK